MKKQLKLIFLCSLFHVVVDNDETVTRILEELNRLRSGRVTFIPLNRVSIKHVEYPNSPDCFTLLSKLRFQPEVEKAFQQVQFSLFFY